MSAIIPRVTDPPAEDRPPRARPTMTEAKFGASATGSWKILTSKSDACRMGLRPSSSDLGNVSVRRLRKHDGHGLFRQTQTTDIPWRPQLTPKRIHHQKNHGATPGGLGTDVKFFGHAMDRIAVEAGVEVQRDLDEEDEGEDHPLFALGEAKAQLVVAVGFGELDLAIPLCPVSRCTFFRRGRTGVVLYHGRGRLGGIGALGFGPAGAAWGVVLCVGHIRSGSAESQPCSDAGNMDGR